MDGDTRFRLLVVTALADGVLTDGERRMLLRCAAWLGVSRERASEIVVEARARPATRVTPPGDRADRERLFGTVVELVLADGRVSPEEARCLDSLARAFQIRPEDVQRLLAASQKRWEKSGGTRRFAGVLDVPTTDAARPISASFRALIEDRGATPGTVIGGQFRIVSQLGTGGFGSVYLARHETLEEDVALKVLHPGILAGNQAAERRFLQEARLCRSFAHRYIPTVREFGRDPKFGLYLAMDLVSGRTLQDVLDADGPVAADRIARLGGHCLEALEEAHRHGIVHRDLKPANVMVTVGPTGEEEARVLDFGVAKAIDGARALEKGLSREGALVGTVAYMSPEQVLGKPVDARSDVYSLAVLLQEALTGCLPYRVDAAAGDASVIYQIAVEPPRDAREARPDVPKRLAETLRRALEKDPARRFESARAFREALG